MPQKDYTEDLLGLKDVFVTKIEESEYEKHIFLECKLESQVCPHCHMETKRVHSYTLQVVKDTPIGAKPTLLHLHKRRYYCPHCGKTFLQKLPFLKRYQRYTQRLMANVINQFKTSYSTKSIAKMNNISIGTAFRILDKIQYPQPRLSKVIAIDEFKGNAGRKFQCILTNPSERQVLDILPAKLTTMLELYFLSFSRAEREKVELVVMDMSEQFADIATTCFPKAKIVVDKFHVCRHVTWALESVRKEVQESLSDEKRKWFKRSRFILLKRSEDLNEEEINKLTVMLSYSEDLRWAYYSKEKFYEFMKSNSYEEAAIKYHNWRIATIPSGLSRFLKCCEMFEKRKEQILRAFENGYTNGYTEGCNNKIKVLKRNCYGVRNFDRFRNRILHMMSA